MRQAYFIPLAERFGIEVIEDSPNKTPAQWVTAAETGNIGWDVSSTGVADAVALIKTDTLEELDLSVVDIRDLLDPIRKPLSIHGWWRGHLVNRPGLQHRSLPRG